MTSGSVFSETLHVITNTKLEELAKKRQIFESERLQLLSATSEEQDPLKCLKRVAEGTKACLGIKTKGDTPASRPRSTAVQSRAEIDLENLDQFLEQARFDPSISGKALENWYAMLLQHLQVQSTKFEYADLYGKLVTEWLTAEKSTNTAKDLETSETFEELPGAKRLKARGEWEKTAFQPANVDVPALQAYLERLFDGNRHSSLALRKLRISVQDFESRLGNQGPIQTYELQGIIQSLVASDVLSNEKREALKDFLTNSVILKELADVLNMRMAAFDRWSWGDFIAVEQRRKINGGWSFHMDVDLLQTVFLHYIGVKWSVFLKQRLSAFREDDAAWKSNGSEIPRTHRLRRTYFLGEPGQRMDGSLAKKRNRMHLKQYFAYRLLDYDRQQIEAKDGEEEVELAAFKEESSDDEEFCAKRFLMDASSPIMEAATVDASVMMKRSVAPAADKKLIEFFAEAPGGYDDDPDWRLSNKHPMEAKQSLLHLLATEIIINKELHGELTCFRTGFKAWVSQLPHEAILAVLSFFGVSEQWQAFFAKFLQVPLRFPEDGPETEARVRRRGTPELYTLSDVFGESMLFCLDFAINQDTDGGLLYRFADDIWFWSPKYEVCATAWSSLNTFSKFIGVELDSSRTGGLRVSNSNDLKLDHRVPNGEIRWGFLYLHPSTGRFEIDQAMVDKHIVELRNQLKEKRSIIGFIQAYNAYVATFFSSNFGRAANCFGREHVDQMLATHKHIQETLFEGSNVAEYIKKTIGDRYGVSNIPDGFLFFPIGLGGLDLKSPFITLLQIRKSFENTPSEIMTRFQDNEREVYEYLRDAFNQGKIGGKRNQNDEDMSYVPDDQHSFFPFEEFVAYREDYNGFLKAQLRHTYSELLKHPKEEAISPSATIKKALDDLAGHDNLTGILAHWNSMDAYWKYTAQIYGPEMCEKFGGLNAVDPGLLPIGMVRVFRDRRTKWQG